MKTMMLKGDLNVEIKQLLDQPISIRNNMKWYYGDVEMFRRPILNILARNIQRSEDGRYCIQMQHDFCELTVEDVPFYAQWINEDTVPEKLIFHDMQELPLDHEMKLYFKGNVPYISFRWEADTRLSLGNYVKLSDYFEFRGDDVYIVPPKYDKEETKPEETE